MEMCLYPLLDAFTSALFQAWNYNVKSGLVIPNTKLNDEIKIFKRKHKRRPGKDILPGLLKMARDKTQGTSTFQS